MPRVYIDRTLRNGATITLDSDTSHYLLRVLRMRRAETLVLFNGNGSEYQAVLNCADRKRAVVRIESSSDPHRESGLRITLGQGVARGERMDFVIQKATELGVSRIAPLLTSRCQVRLNEKRLQNRLAHWRRVLRSACEQSQRVVVPALDAITPLPDWLESCRLQGTQHRLILDPCATCSLKDLQPATRVSVVIGPEGGLDQQETELAESHGFQRIRLGPRTLRTETAALAVLASLQTLWGDL
jgi:16S rRNA (uracil1498-N3)-methyltransferase